MTLTLTLTHDPDPDPYQVLRAYQFRTTVATEDVDLSTRVILGTDTDTNTI